MWWPKTRRQEELVALAGELGARCRPACRARPRRHLPHENFADLHASAPGPSPSPASSAAGASYLELAWPRSAWRRAMPPRPSVPGCCLSMGRLGRAVLAGAKARRSEGGARRGARRGRGGGAVDARTLRHGGAGGGRGGGLAQLGGLRAGDGSPSRGGRPAPRPPVGAPDGTAGSGVALRDHRPQDVHHHGPRAAFLPRLGHPRWPGGRKPRSSSWSGGYRGSAWRRPGTRWGCAPREPTSSWRRCGPRRTPSSPAGRTGCRRPGRRPGAPAGAVRGRRLGALIQRCTWAWPRRGGGGALRRPAQAGAPGRAGHPENCRRCSACWVRSRWPWPSRGPSCSGRPRPSLEAPRGAEQPLWAAKYVVTNRAVEVTDRAMRILGGAGLSRSQPVQRHYRDVRAGCTTPDGRRRPRPWPGRLMLLL